MNCKKCGSPLGDSTSCPVCGTDNKETNDFVNIEDGAQAPAHPMKWYKFLIYFLLFASAAINVIGAITYFAGTHYDDKANLVYAVFPEMKTYDIMMGVCSLAIAAIAIWARFDLAGYKKRSKIMISVLYVSNAVIPLLYAILAGSAINQNLVDTSVISSVIGSLAMVALNWVYFTKRDDLFIN